MIQNLLKDLNLKKISKCPKILSNDKMTNGQFIHFTPVLFGVDSINIARRKLTTKDQQFGGCKEF